jgi:hypothetical protein
MNATAVVISSGERIHPAAVEFEDLRGSLHGVEEVPAVDARQGVESELHRVDDPEVAPAALEAPKEVRVLVGAHPQQLAVRSHHVGFPDGVGVKAILTPKPGKTSTHRIANDAHTRSGAPETCQAEDLRLRDHVGPQRTRLYPGSLRLGVHPDAPHARGVDQDAPVAGSGDGVPGGQHPHAESLIACQAHRG